MKLATACVLGVLAAQFACGAAILGIISLALHPEVPKDEDSAPEGTWGKIFSNTKRRRIDRICYLGYMYDGKVSACTYTTVAAVLGDLATFMLAHSHMMPVGLNWPVSGGFINYRSTLSAAATLWWLAIALVIACLNQPGVMPSLPYSCAACSQPEALLRKLVWVLALVNSGLMLLASLSYGIRGRCKWCSKKQQELSNDFTGSSVHRQQAANRSYSSRAGAESPSVVCAVINIPDNSHSSKGGGQWDGGYSIQASRVKDEVELASGAAAESPGSGCSYSCSSGEPVLGTDNRRPSAVGPNSTSHILKSKYR